MFQNNSIEYFVAIHRLSRINFSVSEGADAVSKVCSGSLDVIINVDMY